MSKKNPTNKPSREVLHTDFKYHSFSSETENRAGFLFSNSESTSHTHDDFAEFTLITSGEWEHVFENKTYLLDKNSLIYLGINTMHNLIPCSSGSSHFTFYFEKEYLKETVDKFFPQDNPSILTTRYKKTTLTPSVSTFLLQEAHKMVGSRSSYNHKIEFQNYMHNLIYFMFFSNDIPAETSTKNIHACLLRDSFDNYLNLDEPLQSVYNSFPVSPTTLIKQFELETGQTITQYRNNKRMEYASLLLKDYRLTVAAVANKVGISSPSHFATEFKKKYGISPKEYAKRHTAP